MLSKLKSYFKGKSINTIFTFNDNDTVTATFTYAGNTICCTGTTDEIEAEMDTIAKDLIEIPIKKHVAVEKEEVIEKAPVKTVEKKTKAKKDEKPKETSFNIMDAKDPVDNLVDEVPEEEKEEVDEVVPTEEKVSQEAPKEEIKQEEKPVEQVIEKPKPPFDLF